MQVTVAAWDDRMVTVDVGDDADVATLAAILEVELSLPAEQQQLLFNGQPLRKEQQLSAAGVKDNDVIMLVPSTLPSAGGRAESAGQGASQAAAASTPQGGFEGCLRCLCAAPGGHDAARSCINMKRLSFHACGWEEAGARAWIGGSAHVHMHACSVRAHKDPLLPCPAGLQLNPDGSAVSPAAFINTIKSNPQLMAQISSGNPRLGKAIREEDTATLQVEAGTALPWVCRGPAQLSGKAIWRPSSDGLRSCCRKSCGQWETASAVSASDRLSLTDSCWQVRTRAQDGLCLLVLGVTTPDCRRAHLTAPARYHGCVLQTPSTRKSNSA